MLSPWNLGTGSNPILIQVGTGVAQRYVQYFGQLVAVILPNVQQILRPTKYVPFQYFIPSYVPVVKPNVFLSEQRKLSENRNSLFMGKTGGEIIVRIYQSTFISILNELLIYSSDIEHQHHLSRFINGIYHLLLIFVL